LAQDARLLIPRGLAARIHLHRGDVDAAQLELAAGNERLRQHGPEAGIDLFFWADATLKAANGDPAGAANLLSMVWNALPHARYFLAWSLIAPDIVRWAAAAGNHALAAAVSEDAVVGAERSGGVPSAVAAALRCQAIVDGDTALAEKAMSTLENTSRRVQYAAAVEDVDGRDALAVWESLGATGDVARIDARLGRKGRRRATPKRPERGWESLTPTELRVVELVASGLTNPKVAAELYVSPRTIETHLGHVFAKLDLTSRVELAGAWARRTA
jgi:DNA-binding CsgD family transcriptional regulator